MPIHLEDLDVTSQVEGLGSALIVPCNMCPAVTVAVREEKPFIRLFKSFSKAAPFEEYIGGLRSRLRDRGVRTEVFASNLPHQWFLCMWTSGQRKKLQKQARQYDAVIVLGCDSAAAIVRSLVNATGCRVIEGMQVAGIMNAKLRLHFPGDIAFEDCEIVPISGQKKEEAVPGLQGTTRREEMPSTVA